MVVGKEASNSTRALRNIERSRAFSIIKHLNYKESCGMDWLGVEREWLI